MLVLFIGGLIAAFWIGFFLAAVVANEKREEELLQMAKKLEDIKRRSGLYPEDEKKEWITWEKIKVSTLYGEMKDDGKED